MTRQWRSVIVTLGMLLPLIEAFGSALEARVREKSKEEIMAGLTVNSALKVVLALNQTRMDHSLASLVQEASAFSQQGKAHRHDASLRGNTHKRDALQNAIDMLNNMTMSAENALDVETQRCMIAEESMLGEMEWLEDEVRRHNADAASARGMVIIAQGNIMTITANLMSTTIRFEEHKHTCIEELNDLNAELKIVLSDIVVMVKILDMIDCSDTSLVQVPFLQKALSKLKSHIASDSLSKLVAFAQEGTTPAPTILDEMRPLPVGGVNVSDVPVTPGFECEAAGCRIGAGGCKPLKDRFLVVNAGILDRKRELEEDIRLKDKWCAEQTTLFESNIAGMKKRLRKEQGDLAIGTQRQNDNEEGSHQKSKQHGEVSTKYTSEMRTCCDNKNTEKGTICAIEKIRAEVNNLKGGDAGIYFVDCSVSDWSDEECSVTCGGGILKRTRSVITQPQGGGVPCPPMSTLVYCNQFMCPLSCEMSDWEGWSGCSAACGGGVKERTRNIQREAAFGGDPCEETETEEACNVQGCDKDCVLSEWNTWSSCSKMCGGGTQVRRTTVKEPAMGSGTCPDFPDLKREQFWDCNSFACTEFLTPPRTTLMCASKVDVIIMIDGSASLGSNGWEQSHQLASTLIGSMAGPGTQVRVALQVFSGPSTWNNYELCTGIKPGGVDDIKTTCGIEWIAHFTEGQSAIKALSDQVGAFRTENWPSSTTLTSVALGEAESELVRGREGVNSVVVVITDGWPMSKLNTKAAAKELQKLAKLIWVPVGRNAPIALIQDMATAPPEDHVIQIDEFEQLQTPWAVNQIISATCPKVA